MGTGGLIEYLCSGVGTFELFGRQTGAKIKRGYLASSFLLWNGVVFREGEFYKNSLSIITLFKFVFIVY